MAIADDFPTIAAGLKVIENGKPERAWGGHELKRWKASDNKRVTVLLDGGQAFGAPILAADAEEGWIDLARRDGKGRTIDGANDRRHGFVEIIPTELLGAHQRGGFGAVLADFITLGLSRLSFDIAETTSREAAQRRQSLARVRSVDPSIYNWDPSEMTTAESLVAPPVTMMQSHVVIVPKTDIAARPLTREQSDRILAAVTSYMRAESERVEVRALFGHPPKHHPAETRTCDCLCRGPVHTCRLLA